MRTFEYRHRVSLEESNLVGNVYYVNHMRWQGRCRELFLHEHAPQVLEELHHGLILLTLRCSCEYLAELVPFDEVIVKMRLREIVQNRISFAFDYFRTARAEAAGTSQAEVLVARGEQQIACMRRQGKETIPTMIPSALKDALRPYAAT